MNKNNRDNRIEKDDENNCNFLTLGNNISKELNSNKDKNMISKIILKTIIER